MPKVFTKYNSAWETEFFTIEMDELNLKLIIRDVSIIFRSEVVGSNFPVLFWFLVLAKIILGR